LIRRTPSRRVALVLGALLAGALPTCGATFRQATALDESLHEPVSAFLAHVESKLPETLQLLFPQPIEVRFVAYPQTSQGDFPIHEREYAAEKGLSFRGHVYGRAGERRGIEFIELNERFLPDILAGPGRARKYRGNHGTVYQLATGTLLHELGHLAVPRLPVTEQAWARRGNLGRGTQRRQLVKRSVPYPKSQRFLDVIGWDSPTMPRNTLRLRSPNAYEYENSVEYFAVNLEFFLLDPLYGKRRPRMHAALNEMLDIKADNDPTTRCFIPTSEEAVEVPIASLKAVQLLRINPGRSLVSRFGHLMLRFLFEGQEGDVSDVVVEFSAYADTRIDWRRGVWGGYPSRLTFHGFPLIAMRYNVLQNREIACIPLRLTEVQRTRLLQRTLEIYWEYRGEYRFFSRNCSTEIYDLVRSIGVDSPRPLQLPRSPAAVCAVLRREGLLDMEIVKELDRDRDRAIQKGYLYPAKGEAMQAAYELISPFVGTPAENGEEYVRESRATDRRLAFDRILLHDSPKATKTALTKRLAALLLLEKLCHTRRCGQLQARIELGDGSDELRKLAASHQALIRFGKEETDFADLGGGYGVPLDGERHGSRHLHTTDAYGQLVSLGSTFRQLCAASFPKQWAEIQGSQMNLDIIRGHFYPLAGLQPKGWKPQE